MPGEVDELREHWERYRAVTLLTLDMLSDGELAWRPRPDAFSAGQQFIHILQTEDFYTRGLFEDDWNRDRARFPPALPSRPELKGQFAAVRLRTLAYFEDLSPARLDLVVRPPHAEGIEGTLRGWLWFVLEHEIHHKGQLSEYLRELGHVPPFFGMVLPIGARPDIAARVALGGVQP